MVLTLKIGDRVIGEIKIIGGRRYLWDSTLPPLHKGWELNLSKIDGNGGGVGRGLKPFARKGGVRQNGGALSGK